MSDCWTNMLVIIFSIFTILTSVRTEDEYLITLVKVRGPEHVMLCQDVTLLCQVIPSNSLIQWKYNSNNITNTPRVIINQTTSEESLASSLNIKCAQPQDIGNYTCHAHLAVNNEIEKEDTISLDVTLNGEVYESQSIRKVVGEKASLLCRFRSYPLNDIKWFYFLKSGQSEAMSNKDIDIHRINETHAVSRLNFTNLQKFENGSYVCGAVGPNGPFNKTVHVFVLMKPQVHIEMVKAVGTKMLYMNWTVHDGNSPIQRYELKIMKNGSNSWTFYPDKIAGGNTSYLLKNLQEKTEYKLGLRAKNGIGESDWAIYDKFVPTLETDPVFIPDVKLKGTTFNSLTVGWAHPPPDLKEYVHYYVLELTSNDTTLESFQAESQMNDFLFMNLVAATTYTFKMKACSDYTKQCWNWSREDVGTTMDGLSDPPENLTVHCRFDNISHASFISVSWQPPIKPFGKIIYYNVEVAGAASFRNEKGVDETETFGPKTKRVNENATSARFDVVPPNTNYTIKVSAITRSRKPNNGASVECTMPPTTPTKDKFTRFYWHKVQSEHGRWLFKLTLPRVSERNGEICCYKVFLVKLKPNQRTSDLPPPEELSIGTYQEAHRDLSGGAYIADTFDSQSLTSDIYLGDGTTLSFTEHPCQRCIVVHKRRTETTTELALAEIAGLNIPSTIATEPSETSSDLEFQTTSSSPIILPILLKSVGKLNEDEEDSPRPSVDETTTLLPNDDISVYDGFLDSNFNYTGFVQVIVFGEKGELLPAYSNYFTPMFPGPSVLEAPANSRQLEIALHVLIGLFVIVLILLIVLFVLHSYTKNVAEEQGIEMTFTNTLMHLCRNVAGRHVPVSSSPPEMPPIAKEELVAAVAEKHRDSDYGFQHEFEMLPDRFHDRTTRASESRENFYKNRYPDIKAYDQTRVRLSQVDGVFGSDYINANFVVGYKERKKFICAQGPMDNTVNDFWRMIWEQHLEMVLMLTNLEEYSKTKCAKYWPDTGEKKFGDFVVRHVQEKRFSDYIVRELKLKMAPEGSEKEKGEDRRIMQYHYLVWKDFQAPDHPSGILKFIRRINEEYSLEKGPILIHCSAGVGRTGTLVALDSLVQQINEENQVAIFNTVCDLRHQRNFLVQSLKQYIFIYKCLAEVSQSGDTELKVATLKSTVEKLRKKENGRDKCQLEEEFEKLEAIVDERGKTWTVGSNEENKSKNKSTDIIPYDRNRVMLAPIPGKEHSTYINASFIEGYDNSESFIIAQDPLPATLSDFWRMISEQCVNTLVMMSDLGDGPKKCIRYWPEPDDESTYDNIKVKYIQSESCPYYTRREFCVTNIKTDDSIITTQFQYNGWPTVEGVFPEVTRGLVELVDQTQENHRLAVEDNSPGPIAVHCNLGADRSSIFVALSILIQQLKIEKCVDIYSVVRKLRSQRQLMFKTYAQYEFVHRAVVNYADLHHMCENGTTSPI